MAEHALFAPSASDRWVHCPGSMALIKDLPPEKPNIYAADGTYTHNIANEVQAKGLADASSFIGQTVTIDGFEFTCDEERAARVMFYVLPGRQSPGTKMFEQRLELDIGIDDQFGTSDRVIAEPEVRLTSDDLKDGHGKVCAKYPVEALSPLPDIHPAPEWIPNFQLLNYGLAALRAYEMLGNFPHLRMRVFQPKLDWVDEHEISYEEAMAWRDLLRKRAAHALDLRERGTPNKIRSALTVGRWCDWCPVRGSCPALADSIPRGLPEIQHANRLTDDDLAALLDLEASTMAAFAAFRAEATARARLGTRIPRWVLTTGRAGPRKWGSDKAVEAALNKALAGDAYLRELIGPPEAEKRLKKVEGGKEVWAGLQSHITRSEGQLKLAPEAEVPSPLASEEFAPRFGDVRSADDLI